MWTDWPIFGAEVPKKTHVNTAAAWFEEEVNIMVLNGNKKIVFLQKSKFWLFAIAEMADVYIRE